MRYINTLEDGIRVESYWLIQNITKGITNEGKNYLSITFQDKTGTIDGKLWNASEENINTLKAGLIVAVNGDVNKYKNNLQIKVNKIMIVDQDTIDPSYFVETSWIKVDDLKQEINNLIFSIKNNKLRQIVNALITKYQDKFYTHPAASRNHHEFSSGLATHVVCMARLAQRICELYPSLNKDLLISGVLLHDLGKVIELSGALVTEYTIEGKLLGHISIMQAEIALMAQMLELEGEEIVLLKHMVLSHHGQLEYGSPVLPLIKEAEILSYIDNIDARMNMIDKELNKIEPGQFTSRIFSLENRCFYKPKEL